MMDRDRDRRREKGGNLRGPWMLRVSLLLGIIAVLLVAIAGLKGPGDGKQSLADEISQEAGSLSRLSALPLNRSSLADPVISARKEFDVKQMAVLLHHPDPEVQALVIGLFERTYAAKAAPAGTCHGDSREIWEKLAPVEKKLRASSTLLRSNLMYLANIEATEVPVADASKGFHMFALGGGETIPNILAAFLPRLEDEGSRSAALPVLHYFTGNYYEEKDLDWWLREFPNSRFYQAVHLPRRDPFHG